MDGKGGIMMGKLKGWMDKAGHYDLQMKGWMYTPRAVVIDNNLPI